jgi:GTPase SAR1 family protein
MKFEDRIKQRLKSLNIKQLCLFSWLCGLRTLPFLSVKRNFAYWPKENRHKFLYDIFYTLDVSASIAFLEDFTAKTVTTVYDTAKAYKVARVTYEAANDDYEAYDAKAAKAAVKAVFDVATVTKAAYDAAKTAAYAAIAVTAAEYAANAANAAYESYIGHINTTSACETLFFNDIKAIKKNKLDECDHDISIYGELWDSFQKDLNAIGCSYWAKFYESLFNNGFTIDKQQLKRHFGVPDEIKDEGAAAVGRYLEGLGEETERLNETRIIILGEKGAGKTSLARRLLDINAKMTNEFESTEGVETSLWRFQGKDGADINVHVWDFAGHSITHAVHRCFMSARCLYIYVYNGRIERDNDPAYWLEQIRIHGDDSSVLFLINEKDGYRADIAEKTLKDEYPSIVDYYRVDIGSADKTKLKKFRQTVMDTVTSNPSWNSQIVSIEAYKIKNKLREHFDKTKSPHITREQFDEIAKHCGASAERIEGILNDLHTLGICLWYNKPEMADFNMLVLNPDWIANGIYRIINQGYNKHKHILTTLKGAEILRNDKRYKYPRDKVAFLFKLMKLYELAFFENTDNIFIPGILPIDRPDGIPAFNDVNDRLTMSFVVEKALPPSIVARIIVQRSEEIFDENLLWRKGAVLKYKGSDTIALIIEESRSITVSVKGTKKTAYIASLRETIKAIFDDYKVIEPDLFYEVLLPEKPEKRELPSQLKKQKPLMLSEGVIKKYLQVMRPYFDVSNIREIPLDETKQAYSINIINYGILNTNLPTSVDEKLFTEILKILKEFLKSKQAKKITVEDFEKIQKEVIEVHKLDPKKGWERLREFLSDAANITAIGNAISTFLTSHPEIQKTILSIFASFMP